MKRETSVLIAMVLLVVGFVAYGGRCGGRRGYGGHGGITRKPSNHVPRYAYEVKYFKRAHREAIAKNKPISFIVAERKSSKDEQLGKVCRDLFRKLHSNTVIVFVESGNENALRDQLPNDTAVVPGGGVLEAIIYTPNLETVVGQLSYQGEKRRAFGKLINSCNKQIRAKCKELEQERRKARREVALNAFRNK